MRKLSNREMLNIIKLREEGEHKRQEGKHKYDSRVRHFIKEIRILNLPNSTKATQLVLNEMSSEKGFSRHDGSDYFVHPIAIAQTALDYKVINELIVRGEVDLADEILTVCLLHDIIEDVDHIDETFISNMFNPSIAEMILNLSKNAISEDESFDDYSQRFSSNQVSALVKILDRLNNCSTLSNSSLKHRAKQYVETTSYYLDLLELFRNDFWIFGDLFHQAKTIIESLMNEVRRDVINEMTILYLVTPKDELNEVFAPLLNNNLSSGLVEFTDEEIKINRCPICGSNDLGFVPHENKTRCNECNETIAVIKKDKVDLLAFLDFD